MLSTRRRTGSDSALNPAANSLASAAPSGAASTDGQHCVGAPGSSVMARFVIFLH
jgi:hypothetical protein